MPTDFSRSPVQGARASIRRVAQRLASVGPAPRWQVLCTSGSCAATTAALDDTSRAFAARFASMATTMHWLPNCLLNFL